VTVPDPRLPEPGKLREIAGHIDTLRRAMLPTWQAKTDDTDAPEVVRMLLDRQMQDDLRAWASYLEETNA
jgi:hypothetical protein